MQWWWWWKMGRVCAYEDSRQRQLRNEAGHKSRSCVCVCVYVCVATISPGVVLCILRVPLRFRFRLFFLCVFCWVFFSVGCCCLCYCRSDVCASRLGRKFRPVVLRVTLGPDQTRHTPAKPAAVCGDKSHARWWQIAHARAPKTGGNLARTCVRISCAATRTGRHRLPHFSTSRHRGFTATVLGATLSAKLRSVKAAAVQNCATEQIFPLPMTERLPRKIPTTNL